jgi:NAD+ kinase
MNFAVFYNPAKEEALAIITSICKFLSENHIKIFTEEPIPKIETTLLSNISPSKIDFSLCLGGDGSILRMVHRHPDMNAPILGINMGSLGFLADTPLNELFETLSLFLEGKYTIENRMMLDGITRKNETCFAVNEIVVHRAQNPSLVDLAIFVDGKYLNTFSADGVIFSTATGSTAYSLSAGGPILTPELEAVVITPISPHTITNRPIVLMPKNEIRVEYTSKHAPVEITFDGFTSFFMTMGEPLIIKRSTQHFRIVCMDKHDYFTTLRTKLHWTGKLKI